MSTESDILRSGLSDRRYILHLKTKDEICLHALSILQAELLPCFLHSEFSSDETELRFDLRNCVPLSEVKGRDRFYIRRYARSLLCSFLSELLLSLHYSMTLNGILFTKDNLFYDREKRKLVCIYLPLKSRLSGQTALLSGCDEHELDELLKIPYEKKWICSSAMEKLYTHFRSDDERSAISYIQDELWDRSRPFPIPLRILFSLWFIFFLSYLFCSVFIERSFAGTIWAAIPGFLFIVCTLSLVAVLLMHIDKNKHEKKLSSEEKEKRRKTRNAQMLFPGKTETPDDNSPLSFSSCPVQFVKTTSDDTEPERFTVWTNRLTIGQDSDMCDYWIDHPSLALVHATFQHDERGFYIEALQTGKGTFKNRKRLTLHEKAYLEDGDLVGIGELEFRTLFLHPVG